MLATLSWLLVLTVLSPGCALLRPTDPYAGLARGSRPSVGGGDAPVVAQPAGPLTLDQAVRIALVNNPELMATAHDTEAAAARRDLAAGQRWPSLHVGGGYSHYLDSQRLLAARENGEPGVFSRDLFSGDLVLTMPLFTGGRITNEIRASALLQQAAEQRLARTRGELVFNVTSLFCGILAQREVVGALEFSRQAVQEHLNRIKELIATQKAAQVDQLRLEVRMADLEQRLVRDRNVLAIQTRVLANLLGLAGANQLPAPAGALAAVTAEAELPIPAADDLLREALARRPDLLAAHAALTAQARTVDAARAARWPTLAFQGSYGERWMEKPTQRPTDTDRAEDTSRLGIVLDIPLFEGGRISARIRQEQARLLAAQEQLRRLNLQIQLEVQTAILNIGAAVQRITATAKAIEQAKESLRIERERHGLGKGSITDVMDAQSALLDAQTTYYRALAEHQVAQAQLRLATGGQP